MRFSVVDMVIGCGRGVGDPVLRVLRLNRTSVLKAVQGQKRSIGLRGYIIQCHCYKMLLLLP